MKLQNLFQRQSDRLISVDILPPCVHMFVGYSNNIFNRLHGSSGGIGTTLLQYLLDSKEVDAVIGVGFDDQDKTRATYKLVERSSSVTELSGSKYVYMTLSPLLSIIDAHRDKKLAVVVEPCFVKALKKLAPQCKYVISFFCGYNITPDATDYLLDKANVKKSDIDAIAYRGGTYPGGFSVYLKNGLSKFFKKENYELVDLLFLAKSCAKCSAFISEQADIVLGDAWIKNLRNATLLRVNTTQGDRIIRRMHEDKLVTLYDIEPSDIVKMHAHNLKYKNFGHSGIMKFIVFLFNNDWARRMAPFHLLGYLSKIRRAFMVGISLNLQLTKKYESRYDA